MDHLPYERAKNLIFNVKGIGIGI